MNSQKEEWEVLETKQVYSDPWIRLRVDTVKRPNGVTNEYSVVSIKGGVGVVALTPENEFYIVGQYRYAPDIYSWEIPKGAFSDFSHTENALDTAKRELSEETGITATKWEELTYVYTLLGSTNDVVHLFLARDLTLGTPHPERTENLKVEKVSFEKFFEMVQNREVTDATSIAAISLTQREIQK